MDRFWPTVLTRSLYGWPGPVWPGPQIMRRYSRPRTLSPDCAVPFVAQVKWPNGLTAMPSPPADVRFGHHCAPAPSGAASAKSTRIERVGRTSRGSALTGPSRCPGCPGCRAWYLSEQVRPSVGSRDLEGRQLDPFPAVGRCTAPPVGSRRTGRQPPHRHPVLVAPGSPFLLFRDVETPSDGLIKQRDGRLNTVVAAAPTAASLPRNYACSCPPP